MTDKVHGFTATPDQFLSGGLPMFTATVTGVDLTAKTATASGVGTPKDVASELHSAALDKLIEALSIRAQPVVMGTPTATKLNFAVEHKDIFGDLTAFSTEASAACGFTVVISQFVF